MNSLTKVVLTTSCVTIGFMVQAQTFDDFADEYCRDLEASVLFIDDARITLSQALQYQKTCDPEWGTLDCPFKSFDEAKLWEAEVNLKQKVEVLLELGIKIKKDQVMDELGRAIDSHMDRWGSICR